MIRTGTTLALAAVTALALAACGDADPDPTSATQPTAAATSATDPATDTPEPSDSTGTEGSDDAASTVPVYFAGATPTGDRLFREFRAVSGDPLTAAAQLVDSGDVLDPDYRTLWPGQAISSVEQTPDAFVVTLNGDAFTEAPDPMKPAEATLAIDQLVRTLQGVAQERLPVQFVRSSGPSTLFGLDVDGPIEAQDWLDSMSMVNVTTPEQDSTVSGDTLEVSGVASSFEATVPWQVLSGEEVVLDGFSTAEGWMDKLYPFEAQVDISSLAPGTYTFVASTDDPSGGEGGGPMTDSKDFTVE